MQLDPVDPNASDLDFAMLNRELDRCKSKVFLGTTAAFYGSIMCSLTFIWTEGMPTAATNGINLWWNPRWFLSLAPEVRGSILMHELDHVARLHMLRQGDRCPDVWNYACDYVINNERKKEGYSFDGAGGLFDDKYLDWAEEDVYDDLNKQGPGAMPPGCFGEGDLDMVPVSPQEKHQVVASVVTAVHQAKMSGAGNVPGGVEEMLEKFLTPVVPWQTLLMRFFTNLLDEDYTWARPNRRYTDMYLPSRFTDDGRLENLRYYIDVSGSISSADALRFNSEVKFVWEELQPEKMSLVQFDTKIQKVDDFNEGDPFDKIKIIGRGGTSLECVRRDMLEEKPTAAIIFSDLYCEQMDPLDFDIPVIWVVVNNPRAEIPFGEKLHIRT